MAGFDLIKINVISELRRRDREPGTGWCSALEGGRPGTSLLSTIIHGQMRSGVKRLAAACRQQAFRNWLEQELPAFFSGRVPTVDEATALEVILLFVIRILMKMADLSLRSPSPRGLKAQIDLKHHAKGETKSDLIFKKR